MQVQEILIIKNGNENYGISIEEINQISRVPILMPLPLRPAGVRGLCSISGSIVSILDMNLLLDLPCVDYDSQESRLLSLNGRHSSNAILVSEVFNTVEIDNDNIEYIQTENDPVIAIYKYEESLIQVLSLDILISKINRVSIESKEVKNGKVKVEVTKEEDSSRFLIFYMQKEKFALDIEYLQEIILADKEFTEVIGSSDEVLGLITLRDELLLVVDLRTYYGFESTRSDKNRILIAVYDEKRVGLLIDSIIDIKSIVSKNIEYMDNDTDAVKISGVIHDEKSLISFFNHETLNDIFARNDSFIDSNHSAENTKEENDLDMEVIVFKLAGKEYSFEVDYVDEIIDIVKATKVVYTDDSIDGIINIRGQIVTIVSLFEKLNTTTTVNEDSKIIICNIGEDRIGFIVDSVSDILNVNAKDIRDDESKIFTSILHLEDGKRLVLSMDIEKILGSSEGVYNG